MLSDKFSVEPALQFNEKTRIPEVVEYSTSDGQSPMVTPAVPPPPPAPVIPSDFVPFDQWRPRSYDDYMAQACVFESEEGDPNSKYDGDNIFGGIFGGIGSAVECSTSSAICIRNRRFQ
jgi:hypothetical protein